MNFIFFHLGYFFFAIHSSLRQVYCGRVGTTTDMLTDVKEFLFPFMADYRTGKRGSCTGAYFHSD